MFFGPAFLHDKVIDTKAPRKGEGATVYLRNLHKTGTAFSLLI